eukprot:s899_g12.t1
MPKTSLNRFILCQHIFSAMVSFAIFVLLAAAQAEHPDKLCLLQKPSERRPQLLGVDSGLPDEVQPALCVSAYGVVATLEAPDINTPLSESPQFLNDCNAGCQGATYFTTLYRSTSTPQVWDCLCCNSIVPVSDSEAKVFQVTTVSNVNGDPHIKTLDGKRYTLLGQGTFSLWHFSGVQAEWKGEVKKVGVDWQVFTHYSGHQAFTKGLLLIDNAGGSERQALEISSRDCQWRARKGNNTWIAVQNGEVLSVLDGQKYVSSFILGRKDGPKGYNHVCLNMQTKDGPRDIAVLSLSCRPQHHINLQMIMKRRDDRQFVDGDAEAAAYFRTVDEASKISMLEASCSKAAENQAKETCNKHLGAYVDKRNADNVAFFDDCVFDLCHGAGESAAEITAELLASNQAVQTMTS